MSAETMDQIIQKLLTDSKARAEWMEIARKLEEKCKDEKPKPEKKNDAPLKVIKRTVHEDCCRLTYEDGFSLCFTTDGGMFLEHVEPGTDGDPQQAKSLKTISETQPTAFKSFMRMHLLDVEDLMFVVNKVGYMFSREVVKAYDRNKKVVAEAEQKVRYLSQDKKKSFMAGIVCGRITKPPM